VRPGGRAYVLAIDHRASFRKWAKHCLGLEAPAATLRHLKLLVADSLPMVIAAGRGPEELAILADTEYGTAAIARAHEAGVRVVVPAERSGLPEFIFEHGDDFAAAITASGADVVKALVRYNPSSRGDRNARSRAGLRLLAEWCEKVDMPLMLELLVPPEAADLDDSGHSHPDFDHQRRLPLTLSAVSELREAGMRPQWWKLEGQFDPSAFSELARSTGAADGETTCLVLGRGAGEPQLLEWIDMAAGTVGFSGFAVGRSLWMGPLEEVLQERLSAEEATWQIGQEYLRLINEYERAEVAVSEPGGGAR
jgi:myo-inositol catabolism protein IolC